MRPGGAALPERKAAPAGPSRTARRHRVPLATTVCDLPMARVTLTNVVKKFGDVTVIPDLNLEIEDKEFVVLVGPSGCGKTTTLRMIAGLESASDGIIRIGDRDVTWVRPGLRNCSMVFQNYALYPHMTVRQNIGYGMKVRGVEVAERDRRIADAARILGLEPYLDRRPRALSGGQRQRVAIGRAIVRDPDVFLFDEPLSNLDAKLRIEMRTEIKNLHQRLQNTVVYVTHRPGRGDDAGRSGGGDERRHHRADGGSDHPLREAGEHLRRRLHRRAVDGFPAGDPGRSRRRRPADPPCRRGPNCRCPTPWRRDGATGSIAPSRSASGRSTWPAGDAGPAVVTMDLRTIEPLGPHTLFIGTLCGERFTALVDAHHPGRPDTRAQITLDMTKMHLFDPETGAAL